SKKRISMRSVRSRTAIRPLLISGQKVLLTVFSRRAFFFLQPIDLGRVFSLGGNNRIPPLTLTAGEPWEVNISQIQYLPPMSGLPVKVRIEVFEADRRRPYRIYPEADRFLKW